MLNLSQKGSLFSALSALATEIKTEKTAAVRPRMKQSDSPVPSDPGGYQGASSHPTANIDNRGQSASEGARSSENESDVKADVPNNVNSAPDAKDGQSDDVNINIGTTQSATGDDPSTEDDYKGGKDDPGSEHPARTDNDSLDGHKYASLKMGQAYDLHSNLANGILADLAMGQGQQLTKEALAKAAADRESGTLNPSSAGNNAPAKPKTQMAGQPPAGEKIAGASALSAAIEKAAAAVKAGKAQDSPAAGNADLQAGYDLAAMLGVEKRAAQQHVAKLIETTIHDAHTDADLFGSYYRAFQKRAAEDESSEGEDHGCIGDDTSGANGAEGNGGETSSGDGGHEGGGGGESLGDMLGGGADPGGLMGGGGAPGGMEGGMGGMEGGMDGGGGMGEQDALMQLAAALDELGIPLEALAAAGAGGGGGAGGGMPPMGGGGPPMGGGMPPMGGGAPPMGGGGPPPMGGDPLAGGGAPPMGEGMKLASAVLGFKRTGRYQFKAANYGSPERVVRDQMKSYLRELLRA